MLKRAGYGGQNDSGIERYIGIQYAELGLSGRFSDAISVRGQRQLDTSSLCDVPVFPQLPSRLSAAMGNNIGRNPQAESAFFLNVWTPTEGSKLPVMFFIHGGAWMTGGGSASWYDGHALSMCGMVVVTINYRLGPLAHLSDSTAGDSANPPYSDIVTALRWVQEHISEFGGDPGAITVVGQSAGSWYAHLLSISDSTRGLFAQVAHLSPASNRAWTGAYATSIRKEIREELQVPSLEHVEVADLLSAGIRVLARRPQELGAVPTPYLPTLDDFTSDAFCSPHVSARKSHAKAIYIRHTGTETAAFFFNSPRERAVDVDAIAAMGASISNSAGNGAAVAQSFNSPYEALVAITSSVHFETPARLLADAFAGVGLPTYLRTFETRSKLDGFMSGHCFDLPFQFGLMDRWADAPMLKGMGRDEFDHVSRAVVSELANFVISPSHTRGLAKHVVGAKALSVTI